MPAQADGIDKAFYFERPQHVQALQLASCMFKTGMDSAWKNGSQVEHGLAAGTGGALLSKATLICGRMADGGRYNREDMAVLARTMSALESWVQECAAKDYDVLADAPDGKQRGPWKMIALSAEGARKNAKILLAQMGVKHKELHVRQVEEDA